MKRAAHAIAWVRLAVAAFVLWPERWGGTMTYVITSGVSMQPAFEQGDLAILRSSSDYRPGDVAAYDSTELQRIVMHRIVEQSDAGYTFQGDNNDFVDPQTVPEEQVLGRLVLRVPAAGAWLAWFLKPINLVIAAAALFFLVSGRREEHHAPSKPAEAVAAEPVLVTHFAVPVATPRAHVASGDDLRRIASRCGRPLIEDAQSHVLYVHDGTVLFTHDPEATARDVEARRGTGRDWCYDRTPVVDIPRPRRAPGRPVSTRRPPVRRVS